MLTFIRLLFDFPQYHSALNSEHFYKTEVNLYHHIHITARLNWRRFLMSQIPSISPKNRYRKLLNLMIGISDIANEGKSMIQFYNKKTR